MKYRNLSKLQIRAEITIMLQKLDTVGEMSREQQIKYLTKLNSIQNTDYVAEILAKELGKVNYQKGQVIAMFLQEIATLEQVKDILWSYIKSPEISDEIKDIAGITLKNMGDDTDPDEFLNYLDDPKSIVDKETKKLLESASVNPEAQIDFLDFLFSLPDQEQYNLLQSLREDYSSEYIVNVVAPALESNLIPEMKEYMIEILGESRSYFAVPVLKDIIAYNKDEKLKKRAKVSLNMIKLAGIDIDNPPQTGSYNTITKMSDIYECHINFPDGMGNQAIIVSREKPNGDILMMNAIINDVHGILDSFGFYGISKEDFKRIVERFQEKSTRFFINAEYCAFLLKQAEIINKTNNVPIPYEYISWKSIIKDVIPAQYDMETIINEWADKNNLVESEHLYKFPDFENWFFEEDDHESIKISVQKIIYHLVEKKEFYIKNPDKLNKYFKQQVDEFLPVIFDDTVRQMYKQRLQNIALLFNYTELKHFRDVAATLALEIAPGSDFILKDNAFIWSIGRKTILEGLIRYEYNLYNQEKQKNNPWNQKKSADTDSSTCAEPITLPLGINELIEILCEDEKQNTRA